MLRSITCLLIALNLLTQPTVAMEFELVREAGETINGYRFPDRLSVYASGEINRGDSEKLLIALKNAGRDPHGNIRMYLNSSGGNVGEALKMSAMTDLFETTAIVKRGDLCASACASVLYLAARIHYVEEGGLLAYHTCTVGKAHASSLCNEAISEHATGHGTPNGSILALLSQEGAEGNELAYVDSKTACLMGLCGPPVYDPTLAIPRFNCERPETFAAQVLCNDAQLARYDASTEAYRALIEARVRSDKAEDVLKAHLAWEKKRDACGMDRMCWIVEYSVQRASLRSFYTSFAFLEVSGLVKRERTRRLATVLFSMCEVEPEQCTKPFLLADIPQVACRLTSRSPAFCSLASVFRPERCLSSRKRPKSGGSSLEPAAFWPGRAAFPRGRRTCPAAFVQLGHGSWSCA